MRLTDFLTVVLITTCSVTGCAPAVTNSSKSTFPRLSDSVPLDAMMQHVRTLWIEPLGLKDVSARLDISTFRLGKRPEAATVVLMTGKPFPLGTYEVVAEVHFTFVGGVITAFDARTDKLTSVSSVDVLRTQSSDALRKLGWNVEPERSEESRGWIRTSARAPHAVNVYGPDRATDCVFDAQTGILLGCGDINRGRTVY